MEKYCLKRNEFESNIRESFRNLRDAERFFDVTLVTDDGQHMKAHKMMLAAGSDFFSDIFLKADHSNMLIYLKGVSSADFDNITDFLYNGEVNIAQDELTRFLQTAQELKVKDLQSDLQGIDQNVYEKKSSPDYSNNSKYENNGDIIGKESTLETLEEFTDSFDSEERGLEGYPQDIGYNESKKESSKYSINIEIEAKCQTNEYHVGEKTIPESWEALADSFNPGDVSLLNTDKEIDLQVKQMIEKIENEDTENEAKCQTNEDNVGKEIIPDSWEALADSFNPVDGPLLNTDKEIDLQVKQMMEKIDGLWECKVCGKTAPGKSNITNHVEIHIENMSHACHICRKKFPTRMYLKHHISGIHSDQFTCDICGKPGMNRKAYTKHRRLTHKLFWTEQSQLSKVPS